jgi:hypothetical protein
MIKHPNELYTIFIIPLYTNIEITGTKTIQGYTKTTSAENKFLLDRKVAKTINQNRTFNSAKKLANHVYTQQHIYIQ